MYAETIHSHIRHAVLSNCDETPKTPSIPTPSGNLEKVWTEHESGDSFYLDFVTMRKDDRYVYWWELDNLVEPTFHGSLSIKVYTLGDCKKDRVIMYDLIGYKEPMGRGRGVLNDDTFRDWIYPRPDLPGGIIRKNVCEHMN